MNLIKININIDTNIKNNGELLKENYRKYKEIAEVVDSLPFQKELIKFRKRLETMISASREFEDFKLPIDYELFDTWLHFLCWVGFTEEEADIKKEIEKNIVKGVQPYDLYYASKIPTNLGTIKEKIKIPKRRETTTLEGGYFFYFNVVKIRNLLNLPYWFDGIIAKATVCNEVRSEDLRLIGVSIMDKNPTLFEHYKDPIFEVSIPTIEINSYLDKESLYKKAKEKINFINVDFDIKDTREYFWEYVSTNESYKDLAKRLLESKRLAGDIDDNTNSLKHRITKYYKKLQMQNKMISEFKKLQ